MKLFSSLAVCAISLTCLIPSSALADDTVKIPQDFALVRVVKLDVTPLGLVLDLGSPISSVNLSHLRDIVFVGLDGALCSSQANCPEGTRPTKLLVRKIPPINFPNQQNSPDGTTMLFVDTDQGLYRFQLDPVSKTPDYTKVWIEPPLTNPAFPGSI